MHSPYCEIYLFVCEKKDWTGLKSNLVELGEVYKSCCLDSYILPDGRISVEVYVRLTKTPLAFINLRYLQRRHGVHLSVKC